MSQQGISRAVRAVELELGFTLFERSHHAATPTSAGHRLLPYLEAVMKDYDAMRREALAIRRGKASGTAAINVFASPFFEQIVKEAIASELQALGLSDVGSRESTLDQAIAGVLSHPDSAIGAVAVPLDRISDLTERGLRFVPLFEGQIVAWGHRSILSPRKRTFTAADAANVTLAHFADPLLTDLLRPLFGDDVDDKVKVTSSNWSALIGMARKKSAVVIADTFTVSRLQENGDQMTTLPLQPRLFFQFGFLIATEGVLPDSHIDYIEAVRDSLKPLGFGS